MYQMLLFPSYGLFIFVAKQNQTKPKHTHKQKTSTTLPQVYNNLKYDVGFPSGSVVKNPLTNAGDLGDAGSIPGLWRPPQEGKGNLLQYSCLGNPMERGHWWATVHEVKKESGMT